MTTTTKQYIYGKALKVLSSDFGKNLQVVVVKNKNYSGKITEYNGTQFTYIKERHLKNSNVENGKYYRFLVRETGNYMGRNFIKRFEITELPQHLQDKYDKISLDKWKAQQEEEEGELQNVEPEPFSDNDE